MASGAPVAVLSVSLCPPLSLCGETADEYFTTEAQRIHRDTEKGETITPPGGAKIFEMGTAIRMALDYQAVLNEILVMRAGQATTGQNKSPT